MTDIVKRLWDSYHVAVLPKDAPPIQISECRQAFYGGALALLQVVSELGEVEHSEDDGVAVLEMLHEEMRQFMREQAASAG